MSNPTNKQINYARKLGIENPEKYTKEELSKKIDEVKEKLRDTKQPSITNSSNENTEKQDNVNLLFSTSLEKNRTIPQHKDNIRFLISSYLKSYNKILTMYDEIYILSNLMKDDNATLNEQLIKSIQSLFRDIRIEIDNLIEKRTNILSNMVGNNTDELISMLPEITNPLFNLNLKAFEKNLDNIQEQEDEIE